MSDAINFTYDSKDRLTQETSTRFGNYTENNEWDDAGNATTYRDVERAFNDDNQIDVYGFEYDGNGNPTTYSGVSASYNANNQLTSYGSHFEAGYRADGLRAYKHWEDTETEDPPAEWTYYLYDGGNAVCELDESGNLLSTNIYAPDGLVAKRMADGTTGSYLFDLQGNTAEIITGSGVKVNAAFNAWGQCKGRPKLS